MKKKLIGFILCGLILATVSGCSDTPTQVSQINNGSSLESADVTSDKDDKDNSDDITDEKDQLSETADSASTESQSEIPAEKKEESAAPPASQTDKPNKNDSEVSSTAESKPTEPEKSNTQTGKPQSPQTNSKIPETSNPQTKPPSEPEPSESTKEPEPSESTKEPEPSEPEFNIQDWIDFAQDYAVYIGLTLNSEAVWCSDNPITASANSKYLQRDLCGTLDKYKRNSDITDVWIWAEQLTESSWEIYIGYA
jgi:hypothetical protein